MLLHFLFESVIILGPILQVEDDDCRLSLLQLESACCATSLPVWVRHHSGTNTPSRGWWLSFVPASNGVCMLPYITSCSSCSHDCSGSFQWFILIHQLSCKILEGTLLLAPSTRDFKTWFSQSEARQVFYFWFICSVKQVYILVWSCLEKWTERKC